MVYAYEGKKCKRCGKEFAPKKTWQEFCSSKKGGCQELYWMEVYREARKIVEEARQIVEARQRASVAGG